VRGPALIACQRWRLQSDWGGLGEKMVGVMASVASLVEAAGVALGAGTKERGGIIARYRAKSGI